MQHTTLHLLQEVLAADMVDGPAEPGGGEGALLVGARVLALTPLDVSEDDVRVLLDWPDGEEEVEMVPSSLLQQTPLAAEPCHLASDHPDRRHYTELGPDGAT